MRKGLRPGDYWMDCLKHWAMASFLGVLKEASNLTGKHPAGTSLALIEFLSTVLQLEVKSSGA